jgi:hypothetical protein
MNDNWRRLVVDSRYRTKESVSNSDFTINLPYAVTIPSGSLMYVDSICLSHAWPTVQTGINDHLYVQERVTGQASDTMRTIQLTPGTYNADELKDEVIVKLNTGTTLSGTYSATVQYGKLTLSNDTPLANGKAYIFSKSASDIAYLQNTFPIYPGSDCNELIGLWDTPVLADGTGWIFQGQSWTAQYMDLQHHKQLFLCSDLGESSMMLMNGDTSCIRRILMAGMQGDVVTDVLSTGLASVSFGSDTTFQTMQFQLKGHDGKIVNLANHQLSFELILVRPGDK